jgi:hypothetical protein
LPAKISAAVGFQIDAGDLFRAGRALAVAATAKITATRFVGTYRPGSNLVLLWCAVATRARQLDMVRDSFGPGNLAVTGSTLLGNVRRFRLMRVVATDAGHQRIVSDGLDLRKTRRPAGVIAVAKRTITSLARRGERVLGRSFGVCRRWAMANLASHSLVSGVAVGLDSLAVAEGACFPSGILNGLADDVADRGCPIVTPLAERFWQEKMSGRDQPADEHGEDNQ